MLPDTIKNLRVGDRVVLDYAGEFVGATIMEISTSGGYMHFDKGYKIWLPIRYIADSLPPKKGWFS